MDNEQRIALAQRGRGGETSELQSLKRAIERDREKLEILAGERGSPERHAVTRAVLARLTELPALSSQSVSGTPTAAEHNALVADVANLHRTLAAIAALLR